MNKKKSDEEIVDEVVDEFLYGEIRGHKTTERQEKFLHAHGVEHGHLYRLPSGKKVKREVS